MIGTVKGEDLRLHFNKHGAAPLVWSVHCGAFEIECRGFRSYVPLSTVYRPKATPDDDDGLPSAWLAPMQILCNYRLEVESGFVTIYFANQEKAP